MQKALPFTIDDIHSNGRYPGVLYARIKNEKGEICVTATLNYCVQWLQQYCAEGRDAKFCDVWGRQK